MAEMNHNERRREIEELAAFLENAEGLDPKTAWQLATATVDQLLAQARQYDRNAAVAWMLRHLPRFKQ